MQGFRFAISTEDCELLVALETSSGISDLAARINKDASVVSRRLVRLASMAPVLEKRQGRWRLTEAGRSLAGWTREGIASQRRVLEMPSQLRLVSTREFASRILAPRLQEFLEESSILVSLITKEDGVEQTLLAGEADLGFDCGRSISPLIRFRRVTTEPFAVVASPAFIRRHRLTTATDALRAPCLEYTRAPIGRMFKLSSPPEHVVAVFNDIASMRAACCAGMGWAVLPAYCVRDEVARGMLRALSGREIDSEYFGVFWPRQRKSVEMWARRAVAWLGRQELGLSRKG